MLRWIIGASIQSRLLVAAIAVGLMVYGFSNLKEMPADVLPEFTQPYVEIQTEAIGLSAAEVEALLTVPMEADMLNGAPWLDDNAVAIAEVAHVELAHRRAFVPPVWNAVDDGRAAPADALATI